MFPLFLSDDNDIRREDDLNLRSIQLQTIEALIFPEAASAKAASAGEGGDRSPYERFAIPYSFPPALSASEAVRATLRTFLRILLGSVLFGVWGACALLAWASIGNPFLRVAAMIPMIALFLVLLCGLLVATTLLLRPRARSRA
jgi:hypothetical protein